MAQSLAECAIVLFSDIITLKKQMQQAGSAASLSVTLREATTRPLASSIPPRADRRTIFPLQKTYEAIRNPGNRFLSRSPLLLSLFRPVCRFSVFRSASNYFHSLEFSCANNAWRALAFIAKRCAPQFAATQPSQT